LILGALALLLVSRPDSITVEALSPGVDVVCADIYRDILNDTPLGSAPDGDDVASANSISRIEPSQTSPGDYDITTVLYEGPDLVPADDDGVGDDTDFGAGIVAGDWLSDTMAATVPCATATTNANAAAELTNPMHVRHAPASQYSIRPHAIVRFGTYDPTNSEDGSGPFTCSDSFDNGDSGISGYTLGVVSFDDLDTDCYDFPGSSPDTLVSSRCSFSESNTSWNREDAFTVVVMKTPKGTNYGKRIVNVATAAPSSTFDTNGDGVGDTASDPNECASGLSFPQVQVETIREPTTDEPGVSKNVALSIPTDPSGTSGIDTGDGLADDYDGDGCTDWDELDKNFTGSYPVSVTGPVHGLDPFNPADCDQNLDSTVQLDVTVRHNESTCSGPPPSGGCSATLRGNGFYMRCIANVSDPKGGGTRALTWRTACYLDSPFFLVNGSYAQAAGKTGCSGTAPADAPLAMCGDGQKAALAFGQGRGYPPGSPSNPSIDGSDPVSKPYLALDKLTYPDILSGNYSKGPNTIDVAGCLEGLGFGGVGPYIHLGGSFDARVGAGMLSLQAGITSLADCQDGPPFSSGSNLCVLMIGSVCRATFVELQSKKSILAGGGALPVSQHRDSDGDGCSDTQELSSNTSLGGLRDPFNHYDYFNPTKDGQNRADDILAVVNQYGLDDLPGPIDLKSNTDRTFLGGSNPVSLGAPDGRQRADDLAAIIAQFFHDC
jgi:hypothetical protein